MILWLITNSVIGWLLAYGYYLSQVDAEEVRTKLDALRLIYGVVVCTIVGFVGIIAIMALIGITEWVVEFNKLPWREEK